MKNTLFFLVLLALFLAGCATNTSGTMVQAVYGTTNPTAEQKAQDKVRRFGTVIELIPEKEQEYRKLHADVWPGVVAAVKKANIRNYTIYITELGGKKYLFSYFEYDGDDMENDFASLGNDPIVRDKWWPVTDACQKRLPGTPESDQWKSLEMIMHIP